MPSVVMPRLATSSIEVNPERLAFIKWLMEQERTKQENIAAYRQYYDGEHDTMLTDRQRQYLELKSDREFNANYCPIVINSLAERLTVTGFDAGSQSEQFWQWWQDNRMDGTQGVVHTGAIRDGETFVMVEWDDFRKRPRFVYEPYLVNGVGVRMVYDDEQRGLPKVAVKRWRIESGPGAGGMRRMNLYWPDRIEKYISFSDDDGTNGNWVRYQPEGSNGSGGQWPIPWTTTGTEAGEPLGIPVVHFKHRDQGMDEGQSDLSDIIPLQDALNKTIIDLIGAADASAFRIMYMLGDDPTGLSVGPGAMLYSPKPPDKVAVGMLDGADLSPLTALKDSFVTEIARISRTPLSFFQISGQRAAEGTLKQEESGLVAKGEAAQVSFGNAWEDAMAMGRRLYNTFGAGGMSEDETISAQWAEMETRNEKEHLEGLIIKKQLGVPLETLWYEAGYAADEIEDMKLTEEYRASLANLMLASTLAGDFQAADNG